MIGRCGKRKGSQTLGLELVRTGHLALTQAGFLVDFDPDVH